MLIIFNLNKHAKILNFMIQGNIHPEFCLPVIEWKVTSNMKRFSCLLSLKNSKKLFLLLLLIISPAYLFAAVEVVPSIGPVRIEFLIFGLILICVALFHKHTFRVAVTGLTVLLAFKFIFDSGFNLGEHMFGTTPFGQQLMDKDLRQGKRCPDALWPGKKLRQFSLAR